MLLSAMALHVAASGGGNEIFIDNLIGTFKQTCVAHVGNDEALTNAAKHTSLGFVEDHAKSSAQRQEWVAKGAHLTFSTAMGFPIPLCLMEAIAGDEPDHDMLVTKLEKSLALTGSKISKPSEGRETYWDLREDSGLTRRIALDTVTSGSSSKVRFSVMLLKTDLINRARH